MTKAAFITHDVGIYGSARSLSNVLNTICKDGLEMESNLWLFYHGKSPINKSIPSNLFDLISHKISCYLPFSKLYYGSVVRPFGVEWVFQAIHLLLFMFDWFTSKRNLFLQEQFDCIHINSHVLWLLLLFIPRTKSKIVVHIRDIIDYDRFPRFSKLVVNIIKVKADRIIAIDKMAAKPFIDSHKVTILTNPFNMDNVYELRQKSDSIYKRFNLSKSRKYITQIGQISDLKGAERFLELALRMSHLNDVHFLMVGGNNSAYSNKIVTRINQMQNISYLGEISDVEEVYAISNVIVRCDSFLPLGRTTWEAYYAGCKVVIPVRDNDDTSEIRHLLNNHIWLYRATDVDDMAKIIEQILPLPEVIPTDHGNHHEYAQRFWRLLTAADIS